MNPLRNNFFGFIKPRNLYGKANEIYNRKPYKKDPSVAKEFKKQKRRYKSLSGYDPTEYGVTPMENMTNDRLKVMVKTIQDFANSHRYTRNKIPDEIKKEYIQKCKEYSLFKCNEWRRTFSLYRQSMASEYELISSATSLPSYLAEEIFDLENSQGGKNKRVDNIEKYFSDKKPWDPNPDAKGIMVREIAKDQKLPGNNLRGFLRGSESPLLYKNSTYDFEPYEFTDNYLYAEQYMQIIPDEMYSAYNLSFVLTKMERYSTDKLEETETEEPDQMK